MRNWAALLLVLSAAGLVDSAYLLSDVFYPTISLICPSGGLIDCVRVTASPYSGIFGVPVALLATLWFASFLGLAIWKPSFQESLLLPLWVSGMFFVAYLVGIEVLVIHRICLYCTFAHVLAALVGVPAYELTLGGA